MIVGIVGGGQLARMIALAGIPLGLRFIFLDPAKDACAAPLGEHLCGAYDDFDLLSTLAEKSDVVTYEFENIPETSVDLLSQHVQLFPPTIALATACDRWHEKSLFQELAIPTVPCITVDSITDLQKAIDIVGLPAILKTRTLGYDGKGQAVLRHSEDVQAAWEQLGEVPLLLEGFADFQRELSIIGARGRNGETRFYALTENQHSNGILHVSRSLLDDPLQSQAEDYALRIMERLDYVGVMALELFQCRDVLLANEIAPRVHNTGHWTIEGAVISQFENHLRAILGLPLGSTEATGHAAMMNFIGAIPDKSKLLSTPEIHLHCYNKVAYAGRKVGHATVCSSKSKPEALLPTSLLERTE